MNESVNQWVDNTWKRVDEKMKIIALRSRNKIPYSTNAEGIHDNMVETDITWWTNGFWEGLMWLLYIGTEADVYKETALQAEKLLDGAFLNYDKLHHDVGFMWHISSGVNWTINKDKEARLRSLYAANILAARFNIKGGFITAWNSKEKQGWTIIDTMMNIPLLYWATKDSGNGRYAAIARAHADMVMRDHIRDDGSVIHIVEHDQDTGKMLGIIDGQGYSKDSCWSRGAAWALYGFILSYIHTGKKEYLNTSKKVAHYFISACCTDWLVRVDLRAPEEPVIYDSTAACCAACGLIEIANHVTEYEKNMYLSAAIKILQEVEKKFCNFSNEVDYLVGYGTHKYPVSGDMKGVHIPFIYGDYFFVEALYKLKVKGILFW